MNELKSCPFCGGEARLLLNAKRKIYGKDEYRTGVVVCCNVCEARMFYGSEKLAIEAWNRRAGKNVMNRPTERQMEYAEYLSKRMCVDLPKEYTKQAYSDFISKWKPIVKHEDDSMNEPNGWQMQYM